MSLKECKECVCICEPYYLEKDLKKIEEY